MKLLGLALVSLLALDAHAQIGAVWTSSTSGSLGSSNMSATGFGAPFLGPYDLTTSDFSGGPLSTMTMAPTMRANSNWTIQFTPPVSNLRVYCIFWRGLLGQAGAGGPSQYTFSRTPTILSGLGNATLSGPTLTCPDGLFHNGILQFSGAISTLSCTTTATQIHYQALTVGALLPPPIGTRYCTPAVVNSTGASGSLAVLGLASVAANDVALSASSLPSGSFGFFLTSRTQGLVPQPGGSHGVLCLGGAIGRYVAPGQVQSTGATGSMSLVLNLATTPQPNGITMVFPGEVWNFQAWHRDAIAGVTTSNFTDAVSVQFQ